MIWVGIIGAKGYFGEALSKMIAGHPEAQVSTVMDLPGLYDGGLYLSGSNEERPGYWDMVSTFKKADIIFSGLPGVLAEDVYLKALSQGKRIIDISEEHNLGAYFDNTAGNAYPGSVYGLAELYKDKMKDAFIAANPSSYCTGALLGLVPLASSNLADMDSVAIQSTSGITSLKRTDRLIDTGMMKNGLRTYKLECTEYAEEVNQQMLALFGKGASADYEAYIIPGNHGITTTIKVNPLGGIGGKDILEAYRGFYSNNPFVEVLDNGRKPGVKGSVTKCFCKIGASIEADSGKVVVTTVLDNAVRGVVGQAIQTMNLMYGIDGKIGL